jgi:hypothetical protein
VGTFPFRVDVGVRGLRLVPFYDLMLHFAQGQFRLLSLFSYFTTVMWGPLMVTQWLTYCATSRNVAGSIPDGVIGIFH